jgi:hypothetical protein
LQVEGLERPAPQQVGEELLGRSPGLGDAQLAQRPTDELLLGGAGERRADLVDAQQREPPVEREDQVVGIGEQVAVARFARFDLFVEPGVVERDRRVVGKRRKQVLVVLVEGALGLLIIHRQHADHIAADHQRHLEDSAHEEAGLDLEVRATVGLVEPDWLAGADHLAGDAVVDWHAQLLGALFAEVLGGAQV